MNCHIYFQSNFYRKLKIQSNRKRDFIYAVPFSVQPRKTVSSPRDIFAHKIHRKINTLLYWCMSSCTYGGGIYRYIYTRMEMVTFHLPMVWLYPNQISIRKILKLNIMFGCHRHKSNPNIVLF